MSITVIIELRVKEGKLGDIHAQFSERLSATRDKTGNESVNVYETLDDPTSIVLIEKWQTLNQYEIYLAWRKKRGDFDWLAGLLQCPPRRRFFNNLGI